MIRIVVAGVVLLFGVLFYWSPDEAYWLEENPQAAIEKGRAYTYHLLICDTKVLSDMSIGSAKEKIENSNCKVLWQYDIRGVLRKHELDRTTLFENKRWSEYDIVSPLFSEEMDMELTMLERFGSFIVMTFSYKYMDEIVKIPERGEMLFAVAIRYYKPKDNRLASTVIRKIANLPLVRNFSGRLGTTGRWVVFDYSYKWNLKDYLEWVLKEGKDYSKQISKEREAFWRQLKDERGRKEFDAASDRGFDFLHDWGSDGVEEQIEYIERLHKTFKKIEEGKSK